MSVAARVADLIHLIRCPRCGSDLELQSNLLGCRDCGAQFSVEQGIPRLLFGQDEHPEPVTQKIRSFYESHPFPDYEGFEDLASLLDKSRKSVFARLLDEQMPFSVRVLECGCGTGQLSNFLGVAHRAVIGTDLSTASLQLAEEFRSRHHLDRVYFLQMDLFHPVFPERSFDYVICNGVLHHTADPRKGLEILARLVRPGGFLVVGLYHRFGRLATDLRRLLFRMFGPGLAFLDPRFRDRQLGPARRAAWFADQYRNPHESKHTIRSTLGWLADMDLQFIRSIPGTRFFSPFSSDEMIFQPDPPAGGLEMALKEIRQAFRIDPEGGFFILVARRKP